MATTIVALFACFVLSAAAASSSSVVEFYVLEELPVGSYVGNVALDTDIYRKYSIKVAVTLRFRVLLQTVPSDAVASGREADDALFSLNELTGEVATTRRIDREVYCRRAARCAARVDIVVQPTAFFEIIRARIHILDLNDNKPSFPVHVLEFALLETQNAGVASSPSTGFLLPEADDPDGPAYGVSRYVIVSMAEEDEALNDKRTKSTSVIPFEIHRDHGQLRVVPTQTLDRETVARYRFRVVALDGGEPRRSGSVDVVVTVTDVNDNSPTFARASLEARVREDSVAGTVVCRAMATDADTGLNAELRYRFTGETQSEHGSTFSIRPKTGAVVLLGTLDYETQRDYSLYVIATDGGGADDASVLTGMISIIVRVEDVNDNAPDIAFNFQQRISASQQSDGAANQPFPVIKLDAAAHVGAFVAHVTVRDLDDGENGRFRCVLLSSSGIRHDSNNTGSRFALRQIYETEYMIVTAARLLRPTVARADATLTVYCADGGRPTLTSEASIVLTIADLAGERHLSDVIPTKAVAIAVAENASVGTVLYCPRPSNRYRNSVAKPVYRITDVFPAFTGLRFLEVDAVSGVLRTKAPLSRKLRCRMDVDLWMDVENIRSSQPLMRLSIVVVNVTLLQRHGAAAVDPEVVYEFLVAENSRRGTYVGAVSASDMCLPVPAASDVEYKLVGEDAHALSKLFRLGVTDGRLDTKASLDRELRNNYSLLVLASTSVDVVFSKPTSACQHSSPRLTTTVETLARLRVIVTDVNDNNPVFVFPRSGNDVMRLSPRATPGHVVSRIVAHDRDAGSNATVSYRIDSRSSWSKAFSIEPTTVSPFSVRVSATDGGSPPLSTFAVLRVVIDETSGRRGWLVSSVLASDRLAAVLTVLLAGVLCTIAVVVLLTFVVDRQRRCRLDDKFRCSAVCGRHCKTDSSGCDMMPVTCSVCCGCCCCGESQRQHKGETSLTAESKPATEGDALASTSPSAAATVQRSCGRLVRPLLTIVRRAKRGGDSGNKRDNSVVTSDYGSGCDMASDSNRSRRVNHNHCVIVDATKAIKSTSRKAGDGAASQHSVVCIQQKHQHQHQTVDEAMSDDAAVVSQHDDVCYQSPTTSPTTRCDNSNVTSSPVAPSRAACPAQVITEEPRMTPDNAGRRRRLPQPITCRIVLPSTAGTRSVLPCDRASNPTLQPAKKVCGGSYWATVAGIDANRPLTSMTNGDCRRNAAGSTRSSSPNCRYIDTNGNV